MLFFMDESGHDRKHTPYELRGGILVPNHLCWKIVESIWHAEQEVFGTKLHDVNVEWKGEYLLRVLL